MDLIGNIFSPETISDIFILKFGLFFSLSLLLPYLSVLIGSQLFSLVHHSKSAIYKNSVYLDFAKYLTEVVTKRIWVRVAFGVLPFSGVTFFYSQLFPNSSGNLLVALVLFISGICLSVTYKGSFKKVIYDEKDNITSSFSSLAGWIGIISLLVSSFIVITYLQSVIVSNGKLDSSLFSLMFSTNTIIYFLLFLAISFSISSAVIVARMNRSSESYSFKSYARDFAGKTGILFAFIQPILFILNIFSVSSAALSFPFFITSLFILLLMLVISVQFYLNFRSENLRGTSIVFVFLILFSFLIYNAQATSESIDKREAIKKGQVLNLFS